MKNLVYAFAILFATQLFGEISSATKFIPQDFDVLSYNVYMDLTAAPSPQMHGYNEIKFVWTTDLPDAKFYFHLSGLSVDSAFCHSEQIPIAKSEEQVDGEQYYILSRADIADQDTAILKIYYSGTMSYYPSNFGWAGVTSTDGILYSMGVGFSNPAVSSSRYWMPCYDHPSDKALLNASFLVDSSMSVASNGIFEIADNGDGTKLFSYTHSYPIATYLANFAVGKFNIYESDANGIPVQIFYLPEDSATTRYYYKKVPEMVATFEKYFGEYPFEKVGYVNTPTGSMEHQTMISLDRSIVQNSVFRKDSMASTAVHELSHQWFGNMISPFDFRDAWLNESFATYCEALWQESTFGKNAYLKEISKFISVMLSLQSSEGVLSLYDFDRTGKSSNYPATIYYKGAAVLSLLRYQIGDEAFFGAINKYVQENKYDNVTTDLLKSALKSYTRFDIDKFFDEWIYSKGFPVLEITFDREIAQGDNSANILVKQVQADSIPIFTNFPLVISYKNSLGDYEDIELNITEKEQAFTLHNLPPINTIYANIGKNVRVPLKVNLIDYTSVAEGSEAPLLFPNPTSESFNLIYRPSAASAIYAIYDAVGRQVAAANIDGAGKTLISTQSLPSGNYTVKISDGDKVLFKNLNIVK